MPYYPVRKDFAFDVRCHANCGHKLRSNVATILRDENGKEYPFGKTCARKQLDAAGIEQLRRSPDFTKAAPGQEREGGPRNPGDRTGGEARDDETVKFRRAVTYLLLRQDRLAHVPGAHYDVLEQYHTAYLAERTFSEAAIRHITNIERKAASGKYGFDNLQAVYAFDQCIGRAIHEVPEDRRGFLTDIQQYLRDNLYLTQGQVNGLDQWLRRIDGYLPLDSSKFWRQ